MRIGRMKSRLSAAQIKHRRPLRPSAAPFQFSLAGLMLATSILGGVLGLWLHFSPVELFALFVGLPVCGTAVLLGFIVFRAMTRDQAKGRPIPELQVSIRSFGQPFRADPATIVIGVLLLGVVIAVLAAVGLIVNSQIPLFYDKS